MKVVILDIDHLSRIIALMLGRLRMGIDEAIHKYNQILDRLGATSSKEDRSNILQGELQRLCRSVADDPNAPFLDGGACKTYDPVPFFITSALDALS